MGVEPDFGGYASKAGLKCSDGRTITPEAFKHMDGMQVPLVWMHGHSDPKNVLGYVQLEARHDGMYCHGYFNNTDWGQATKALVQHKDVKGLSIYANELVEKMKTVLHGAICEVSLVLKGANKGALIDYVRIAHSDGDIEILEDTAIIHTGLDIEFDEEEYDEDDEFGHADMADELGDDATIEDVYNTLNDQQLGVLHYMIGIALEGAAQDSAAHSAVATEETPAENNTTPEGDLTHQEGTTVTTSNVFELQSKGGAQQDDRHIISHDDMKSIFENAKRLGSAKAAVEAYALAHGVDNIDTMFPDSQLITNTPEWFKRRTEWVDYVMKNLHTTPFARVRTLWADLTLDQARAKGYVKGSLKKEEFIKVYRRETTPTTVYKKQSLHRDDIVDITDFDVVAWIKSEMRLMLDEEVARAILIGDGREADDEDKISETNIRPIASDDDLYAVQVYVNLDDADSTYIEFVDAMVQNRKLYKGSGQPTLFVSETVLANLVTMRDADARLFYRNLEEIATQLRVSAIIPVEVLDQDETLLAVMVNLADYNIGMNRGGEVNLFDQFDIDYNKEKFLMETRLSGALVKVRSALVFRKTSAGAVLVTPNAPTFVASTGVVTIVATTGVVYKNRDTGATLSTGAQTALAAGAYMTVEAYPASSSYFLANTAASTWTFVRDHA
jgi:hypothetical protein